MLTRQQLDRARALNRTYAHSLQWDGRQAGWARYYGAICYTLGHRGGYELSEDEFAQLVSDWQYAQGLSPADGVIGGATWARLQPLTATLPFSSRYPNWLSSPGLAQPASPGAETAETGSSALILGRSFLFFVFEELPEVGQNLVRKVAVIPQSGVLTPRAPNGTLRPAVHALGDTPNLSQFLSASNRPYGSVTGGNGARAVLIDAAQIRAAGGKIITATELIDDLTALARQNPRMQARIARLIDTIRNFEGETLIRGATPRGGVRPLTPRHLAYLRAGEAIWEQVTSGAISRAEGARLLGELERSYGGARAIGRVGRGLMVIGVVLTVVDMGIATQQSIESGSVRPVAAETIRQVGGWGSGIAGAKIGLLAGAAVGIETGPGAIVTGAAGALIFGFAGYWGADWVADMIHEN